MAQAAIPIAVAVAAAVAGAGASALLAPKPQIAKPQPMMTRNDAAAEANQDRSLRARRGAAANMITGSSGAEAPSPGTKALLGQ